jgi:hypothetical protein
MSILEGGIVIEAGVPRAFNPFGDIRLVPSVATIQSVVDVAAAGDIIYIEPGEYDENLVISTAGLTLVGMGARGQPWINPAAGGGLQVTAEDTVIINLGVAGAAAADYALNLKAAHECRFYGCKVEGPDGVAALLDGTDDDQCSNILFKDCEWIWCGVGVEFDNSLYGYPSQITFRDCLLGNITTAAMRDNPAAGGVVDLTVTDCVFAAQEDGTEPTDYLLLDRVGNTGMFSGNRFAHATNEAAVLTIAAGIIWAANATEAGWSTGRPS